MLRDRFRQWQINDKNQKRKRDCRTVPSRNKNLLLEHQSQEHDHTEAISGSASTDSDSQPDLVGLLSVLEGCSATVVHPQENRALLDQALLDITCGNAPARPLQTPAEDRHLRRTLTAIQSWYDSFWEKAGQSRWEMEEDPLYGLMNDFREGIYCVDTGDADIGYSLLRKAGNRAGGALTSRHPASFLHILQFLLPWKEEGHATPGNTICSFLASLCKELLGPLHPFTLLTGLYTCQRIIWELCDHLFHIMQAKFIQKIALSQHSRNTIRLRIVYAWNLLQQRRFAEVYSTLHALKQPATANALAPEDRAEVGRLLGLACIEQGYLKRADYHLRKAWASVVTAGKEASKEGLMVLEDRAGLFWQLREWASCESALNKASRLLENKNLAARWRRCHVVKFLHDVLIRQRKLHEAEKVRVHNLDIDFGTPLPLCCDSCDHRITTGETFFNCVHCDNGDFDICKACFDGGKRCEHAVDHLMEHSMPGE